MATASELRQIISDTVARLFTDQVTTEIRESAEKGQWPAELWQAVEESGLTLPLIPETHGGGGGTWQDAYVVIHAAGRFAVPLPIAETIVAAWLLAESGLEVPSGPLTLRADAGHRPAAPRAGRRRLAPLRHGDARALGPLRRPRGGRGRRRPPPWWPSPSGRARAWTTTTTSRWSRATRCP